jgi:hypothetical protein
VQLSMLIVVLHVVHAIVHAIPILGPAIAWLI